MKTLFRYHYLTFFLAIGIGLVSSAALAEDDYVRGENLHATGATFEAPLNEKVKDKLGKLLDDEAEKKHFEELIFAATETLQKTQSDIDELQASASRNGGPTKEQDAELKKLEEKKERIGSLVEGLNARIAKIKWGHLPSVINRQ